MIPKLFHFIDDPLGYDNPKYYKFWKITSDGGIDNANEALKRIYEDEFPDPPELNFNDTRAFSKFDTFFDESCLNCSIGSAFGSINYDTAHGFHLDYDVHQEAETKPVASSSGFGKTSVKTTRQPQPCHDGPFSGTNLTNFFSKEAFSYGRKNNPVCEMAMIPYEAFRCAPGKPVGRYVKSNDSYHQYTSNHLISEIVL